MTLSCITQWISQASSSVARATSHANIAESQAVYSYANHPTGTPWVEALQASVRPVITYAFFLVFAVVKVSALATLLQTDGITLAAALKATWYEETQALFASDVFLVWQPSDQQDASGWLMRHVTEEGLNLVKRFEGFSPTIYICLAGYPTIGYGHVVLAHEEDQFAAGITQAEATELLRKDLRSPNEPSCG